MTCLVSSFPIDFDPYFLALLIYPMGDSRLKGVLRVRLPIGPNEDFWVIILLRLVVLAHLGVSLKLGVFLVFLLSVTSSLMGLLRGGCPLRFGHVGPPPLLRVSSLLVVPHVFSLRFVYQAFNVGRRFFAELLFVGMHPLSNCSTGSFPSVLVYRSV